MVEAMMTATDAPQRKARTSSRGGSGSHRSSHRYASTTTVIATLDRTNPIAVPTGFSAVSAITINPATVPSTMITASGAPTLRIRL